METVSVGKEAKYSGPPGILRVLFICSQHNLTMTTLSGNLESAKGTSKYESIPQNLLLLPQSQIRTHQTTVTADVSHRKLF